MHINYVYTNYYHIYYINIIFDKIKLLWYNK